MSRSERSMTSYRSSAPSVVERLADLYGNGGRPGDPKRSSKESAWAKPRKQRRAARKRARQHSYTRSTPRNGPSKLIILLVVLSVAVVGLGIAVTNTTWISVVVTGVDDGQVVRGDQLDDLELRVRPSGRGAGEVIVMLNGAEIPAPTDDQGVVRASLASASDGTNIVSYRVKSRLPLVDDLTGQYSFTVQFGPWFTAPQSVTPPTNRRPAVIRGLVDDDVTIMVNGEPAVRETGMYEAKVGPGSREAVIEATAPDGTMTKAVVQFDNAVVKGEPMQGFHVSETSWRWEKMDGTLERLAEEGRINSVVLTIKDEHGIIGYPSEVPLAKEINAIGKDWRQTPDGSLTLGFYDARQAIDRIHDLGLKAVGRITCFLDPQLATWAYNNGRKDMLVLKPDGTPLSGDYGDFSFTNFADSTVMQYNIDLMVEAANLGFDAIMLDYVRRPEGPIQKFQIPGLDVSPQVAIARFVKSAREQMPGTTELGLALFGISATRPNLVGQDVRLLSPLVDFVTPMVYPSLWAPGEYKVAHPIRTPGEIVEKSTADFVKIASGGGAYTVPFIQDYDVMQYVYGPEQVAAQATAAYKAGGSGFFVWNAEVEYDFDGLPIMPSNERVPDSSPPTTAS